MRESLQPAVAGELNRRGVGCTQFYTERLHERIDSLEMNITTTNRNLIQQVTGRMQSGGGSDEVQIDDKVPRKEVPNMDIYRQRQ